MGQTCKSLKRTHRGKKEARFYSFVTASIIIKFFVKYKVIGLKIVGAVNLVPYSSKVILIDNMGCSNEE